MEHDPELQRLFAGAPPQPSPKNLDEQMMLRFRGRRQTFWRRRIEFRASIPAPIVILIGVLAAITGLWFVTSSRPNEFRERMAGFEPVAVPRLVVTRGGNSQ